jgi:Anti-sigma factor NepR
MTSGKPPSLPRQLPPERDESEPREGRAVKERSEMMLRQSESVVGEGEGLDPGLQAQIGQKLRAMFDEVAKAPIPDKFLDLLDKLESQEKSK